MTDAHTGPLTSSEKQYCQSGESIELRGYKFLMPRVETHFGHWRGLMRIAEKQLSSVGHTSDEQLSLHCASIILSRTSLETYLNEGWFSIRGQTSRGSKYKSYVGLHVVKRYRELLKMLKVAECPHEITLATDIILVNQIRNFCNHYTGVRITDTTHK